MLLASGLTSGPFLRQPTSNDWSMWECKDSSLSSQPGQLWRLAKPLSCITAQLLLCRLLPSPPLVSIPRSLPNKHTASILELASHPTTFCIRKLMCLKKWSALLYFLNTHFSTILWSTLEITFSLANWDHHCQVESEPTNSSTFSIFERCYHSTYNSFFGFHHTLLFGSFELLFPYYLQLGLFFLLLLTCRHSLGSLLCRLLIRNNLSAVST